MWLKSLDLAPKTKGNIRNVMAVIFNCAMRLGIVEQDLNPLSLVRIKGISRRLAEPRILAADEIQSPIDALPMEPSQTIVVMALSTGLRCSELFALNWHDIDWARLTLLVRLAIVDGVVGEVKTKYSQSGLPLDPVVAEILFAWKRASEFGRDTDWVFASPLKAGELPLRSTAVLANHIKPAVMTVGRAAGWDGIPSSPLQLHAAAAWHGHEGAAGIAETRRRSNHDECLHSMRSANKNARPIPEL